MKYLICLFFILFIIGCSSKPDAKEDFDKELKSRTTDEKEKVGLKGDKIMIKKRIFLEEELFKIKRETEDLENSIFGRSKKDPGGIWAALKDCRDRLADPRLGGSGVPEPMEKWEKISETQNVDYEFMVDKNGSVIGVSEEELSQRLDRMKSNKRVLTSVFDDLNEKLTVCEAKYRTALVQHGLDPEDTKSRGEWVDGPDGYKVWRVKRSATTNPEELMRRKQKSGK